MIRQSIVVVIIIDAVVVEGIPNVSRIDIIIIILTCGCFDDGDTGHLTFIVWNFIHPEMLVIVVVVIVVVDIMMVIITTTIMNDATTGSNSGGGSRDPPTDRRGGDCFDIIEFFGKS